MMPSPRMGAGLCIKQGSLFLYGGTVEDGDKQYTLNDMFSIGMFPRTWQKLLNLINTRTDVLLTCLDLHKLGEWDELIHDEQAKQEWIDSESSDEMGSDESDSGDDDEDAEDGDSDEEMDEA